MGGWNSGSGAGDRFVKRAAILFLPENATFCHFWGFGGKMGNRRKLTENAILQRFKNGTPTLN